MLWRQKDWERNSVQMLARAHFSHKQCTNKNNHELQDMLHDIGINWNDLPTSHKRGRCIVKETIPHYVQPNPNTNIKITISTRSKWVVDNEIPIFSQDKNYIEKYLKLEEE